MASTTDGAVTWQSLTGTFTIAADGELTLPIIRGVELPSTMLFYLTSSSRAMGIRVNARDASCRVLVRSSFRRAAAFTLLE